jgi:hypothetical protein
MTLRLAANDIDDLYEQLHKQHQNVIWNINENGSITYFTDADKTCLIAVTNLFAGFWPTCIYGEMDNALKLSSFENIRRHYQETTYEQLSLEQFKALVKFLEDWSGEYGDDILSIVKDGDAYELSYRYEG